MDATGKKYFKIVVSNVTFIDIMKKKKDFLNKNEENLNINLLIE